ncbi:hypothetical protein [Aquibacillus sediminis]|uniref:hypothetical protein n=1 Tax=Aquibacillus sediminis TaxID=2574734 RepID=UPI0011092449|nr:hypothetical protein [Aquibacillus sediminis]
MRGMLNLMIIFLVFMTACTQNQDVISEKESEFNNEIQELTERLNEKENQIKELTQNNMELTNKVDSFTQEKELFPVISHQSRKFIQVQTTGDKEKLKPILSDDVELVEKDNKLYVNIDRNDVEWLLHDSQSNKTFDDWVIQGYHYDHETETCRVHIRQFYSDEDGEPVSPPTFLNITFEQLGNDWKIVNLGFDV